MRIHPDGPISLAHFNIVRILGKIFLGHTILFSVEDYIQNL